MQASTNDIRAAYILAFGTEIKKGTTFVKAAEEIRAARPDFRYVFGAVATAAALLKAMDKEPTRAEVAAMANELIIDFQSTPSKKA